MTARYSWKLVAAELKAAQSTLTRAAIRHRPRVDPEWHDAGVQRVRLALAEAVRVVKALRAGSRAKARRAA